MMLSLSVRRPSLTPHSPQREHQTSSLPHANRWLASKEDDRSISDRLNPADIVAPDGGRSAILKVQMDHDSSVLRRQMHPPAKALPLTGAPVYDRAGGWLSDRVNGFDQATWIGK